MSDQVIEHEHMTTHGITESHHPGPLVYIVVAIALTILTGFEIGVFYAAFLQAVLVPLLIILAICKFILVAMFYMHLHYDSGVFSAVFLFPLWVALLIVVSLMLIFFYLSGHIFLTTGWTF
ncbi:MAG: cytochrome C oxidase subunit IV family protein [Candidatus Binataceae bacterium]